MIEKIKILLLLRHAKSSWKNKELDDHDRPLNKRGIMEAIKMGEYLKKTNLIPDVIVTSSALRALDTTTLVCRHSDYKKLVEVNFTLHKGGIDSYIKAIAETPEDKDVLMLVGHNPVLEELVTMLTNSSINISTCTMVQINLYVTNWKNIVSQYIFRSEIVKIWKP